MGNPTATGAAADRPAPLGEAWGTVTARLTRSCELVTAGSIVLPGGWLLHGSSAQPRQPKSRPKMAFGRTRGLALKGEWRRVPSMVDILVTHTPPAGMLDGSDATAQLPAAGHGHQGCEELTKRVAQLCPTVHIFGHVHRGYGTKLTKKTCFVNASSSNESRGAGGLNQPLVVDVYGTPKRSYVLI